MTHDTIARSIKVFVHNSHGSCYAHSPDLPGLSVAAESLEALDARIIEGVQLLYKLNWDADVMCMVSRDPATELPVRSRAAHEFTLARAA